MPSSPDHSHHVRRVILPSGKAIEVVYFEQLPVGAAVEPPASAPAHGELLDELHVCPDCSSELVYPVEWEESGETHWRVSLRCPNCEWRSDGVFAQEDVERFDEVLDRGTESLVSDLKRLMHANTEEEIDRFAAALNAGHIVPDDF